MSNIIKASAITYTQEKRKIDFNSKAEEFAKLFVEKHANVVEETAEGEFVPGIAGIFTEQTEPLAETEIEPQAEEILAEAKEQAEQILAMADNQAKEILDRAETEAEQIRVDTYNQAKEEGYASAKKQADKELAAAKKQLEEQKKQNQRAYEKQVTELEPAFVEMVIRLVQKLTGVMLEEKREIILYLVEQAMSEIDPVMNYLIHVSPEDYDIVNTKKKDLEWKLKEGAVLEVVEDRMLKRGQCMIETDSRIFDCSIDTQLKNLSSDLRMLTGGSYD